MATSIQERLIARRYVAGESISALAEEYGYTYQGMYQKLCGAPSKSMQEHLRLAQWELEQHIKAAQHVIAEGLLPAAEELVRLSTQAVSESDRRLSIKDMFSIVMPSQASTNITVNQQNNTVTFNPKAVQQYEQASEILAAIAQQHSGVLLEGKLLTGEASLPKTVSVSEEEAQLEARDELGAATVRSINRIEVVPLDVE